MSLADAAVQPAYALGGLVCAALSCLFLVSSVALVVVLVRRSRKSQQGGES